MNGPVPARKRERRETHYCSRCRRRLMGAESKRLGVCGPCERSAKAGSIEVETHCLTFRVGVAEFEKLEVVQ